MEMDIQKVKNSEKRVIERPCTIDEDGWMDGWLVGRTDGRCGWMFGVHCARERCRRASRPCSSDNRESVGKAGGVESSKLTATQT